MTQINKIETFGGGETGPKLSKALAIDTKIVLNLERFKKWPTVLYYITFIVNKYQT